jgi:diguanylate cyclase (GGDEF)-like protein
LIRNSARHWHQLTSAQRDTIVIALSTFAIWLAIERTETCDRVFAWIAANPDYEVDSALLAFMLGSVGIAISAIRRFKDMRRAIQARDSTERDFQTLAYHDPLTALPNRRALHERLQLAEKEAHSVGLILLDLDRFKNVNDVHGHAAGDRLLRLVAERIGQNLEPEHSCYRLGGDEFAILFPGDTDLPQIAEGIARRLVQCMGKQFRDGGLLHYLGASAGVALFPSDAREADALVRAADVALYRAKEAGRGKHCCFEPAMDEQIRWRARIEHDIRLGIAANEFIPFYQPLVSLDTGKIEGFELLARWARPDGEEIGPDAFIPIAEECGLVNDIMSSMLDHACQEARDWDPAITIAINISPSQLMDPWLGERVLSILTRHGFPPQRLGIEITEQAIIADEVNASHVIQSFKNQGMRIALDDFGTGYSSLHHLRILPFDKIKIDRSFVMEMQQDPEASKIIKAIIGLAKSLDMPVIAEGIETVPMANLLREMGCAQGQGYHFGRPQPGWEAGRLLAEGGSEVWHHEAELPARRVA